MPRAAKFCAGKCKYRDQFNKQCPHGCYDGHTVCHKYARNTCTYANGDCPHGFHENHTRRPPPPPPSQPASDNDPVEGCAPYLKQLVEDLPDEELKYLLLRVHPDRYQGRKTKPFFEAFTKIINSERDKI
jgi:hypothetical protein